MHGHDGFSQFLFFIQKVNKTTHTLQALILNLGKNYPQKVTNNPFFCTLGWGGRQAWISYCLSGLMPDKSRFSCDIWGGLLMAPGGPLL